MRTPTVTGLTEPGNATNVATDQQDPASVVERLATGGEVVPIPRGNDDGVLAPLTPRETSRYRAAADQGRRLYPGSVGELVHRELTAYAEFGYRMACDALIPRLAAEVLAAPAWRATGPVRGTAIVHE